MADLDSEEFEGAAEGVVTETAVNAYLRDIEGSEQSALTVEVTVLVGTALGAEEEMGHGEQEKEMDLVEGAVPLLVSGLPLLQDSSLFYSVLQFWPC